MKQEKTINVIVCCCSKGRPVIVPIQFETTLTRLASSAHYDDIQAAMSEFDEYDSDGQFVIFDEDDMENDKFAYDLSKNIVWDLQPKMKKVR